ncbi:MAG: DUF4175 family protein [Flavobacterium sp.]
MSSIPNIIFEKLEIFIRKYYSNQLLKGTLLFLAFGLGYLLFTAFVEYFLWLPTSVRTLLFWLFVVVEVSLFLFLILWPLLKLFKLQKGLDAMESSKIIGAHFPEVSDKLTNFLQLSQNTQNSELLLAAISQKAEKLALVPFVEAIPWKKNWKYVPWAVLPILVIASLYWFNQQNLLQDGFNRVVNYQTQYTPPAPYQLVIQNQKLMTQQGKDFTLQVAAIGNKIPDQVTIQLENESYYLEKIAEGSFQFTFTKPIQDVSFKLITNKIETNPYILQVSKVPTIFDFQMVLNYPKYMQKKPENIQGTGNALVPEGTTVQWKIKAEATNQILWETDKSYSFQPNENQIFAFQKTILEPVQYTISTSNQQWKNFEKIPYQIQVIKDQYPQIQVNRPPDSLKVDANYLIGQVSDDYGLTKLQIVYYPENNPTKITKANIALKDKISDRFVYRFPGNLPVEKGVSYAYYFEVFDNDAIHQFKSTKSVVFSEKIKTDMEKEDQLLKDKNNNINSLNSSIKEQNKNISELEKLQNLQKQKKELDFKDRQKIQDFIQRQKQNEELMKEFSNKLKDNLQNQKTPDQDPMKKELERRMDQVQKESDKNKQLLEELQRLSEKLNDQELFDKMQQLQQKSKNQTKNLEQLVELTKRFYLEKKMEQIGSKLEKLAEKQEKLADDSQQNNANKQEEIQKQFKDIQKEMRDLEKENQGLKKPMDLPNQKEEEKQAEQNIQNAKEDLQQNNQKQAQPKQKNAAQKMKQMSMQMKGASGQNSKQTMQEDVKMLRQILDNLLAFSFNQENLITQFKNRKRNDPNYAKGLKKQQELKQQFRHIDDSLYVISLRNAQITERITEEVGKVHYNLDKSLETLADMNTLRGTSHQQFTITAANTLADFLSNVMNNMQMQMSGSGSGQGMPSPGSGSGESQLKDIIQKQGKLSEKMKEGMEEGEKPGEKPGDKPGDKPGEKPGQKEEQGNSGGSNGKGEQNGGDGEENAKLLMEIFKEQRKLRQQLEDALQKQGLTPDGRKILDQMKDAEKQLLNKGFKNEIFQKMLNIRHELLKLEKAIQQQGEDNQRKSETNQNNYNNQSAPLPESLQKYLKSIENLNRQSLPLQSVYQKKVEDYFKQND